MEHKEAFFGFLWEKKKDLKMPSNRPTFEGVFFSS